MKKRLVAISVASFAVAANAALVTSEDGSSASWDTMDFTTIETTDIGAYMDVLTSTNNTENWNRGQTFTAAHNGTVESISVQALRLDSGGTFAMDVYESFDGDGSTYTASPSKLRPWATDWLNPILTGVELTIDSSNDIASGGVMTVNLDAGEQFEITEGAAYCVVFRRTSTGDERLLWQYAESDVYADGAWGYTGQALVTGREYALAYSVPEPATFGMLGVFGFGMLYVRRLFRR